MAQSILLNTGIAMAGRLGTLVLGLMAVALTTRFMAVGDFGIYSLVLTIGTFLQLTADFGLYLTASKELGSKSSEIAINHIVSLRLMLLGGVFLLGLIGFLLVPSLRVHASLFIVCALGLSFQSVSQIIMSVFQANGVVWRASVGDLAGRIAQVLLLFYIGYLAVQASISPVAVALTFSTGLLFALCIHVALAPHKGMLVPRASFATWRKIILVSWPMGLLLVLNVIYFKIDTVMIALFRSPEEVGLYSLAYKIVENTLFFPAMLGGLILPHISAALTAKNTDRSRVLVEQALLVSCSLALPAVAILVVFARDIVVLISGSAFAPSGAMLAVLAWAAGIMFIGNILGFVLIALSRQQALLKLYSVLVIGNIIGNLLLVPRFGALGASWATVVTEGVATTAAAFFVYRDIKWRFPYNLLLRGLAGVGAALFVGAFLPESVHVAVRIFCVCALYGIIGYYNGMWNASTVGLLRSSRGV